MLTLTKWVMEEYYALLLKIRSDAPIKVKVISNLEHLVHVKVLHGLSCVLPFLKYCITLSSLIECKMYLCAISLLQSKYLKGMCHGQ
jgi:hypothetical protein